MAKRKASQEVEAVEVQEVAPAAVPFWEKNPKILLYAAGAAVALLAGWLLYKELIAKPQQKEAIASMWQAEQMFTRDSFQLALDSPGAGFDGFATLAEKYSGTPAGNSAKYYAAVCCLQTGDFDKAIGYMEDYDPAGNVLPIMKYGVLGDCYSEKQDFSTALSYYEKATNAAENAILTAHYLKKLGMLHEKQGNTEAALKAYSRLYRDYPDPNSADWRDVEKYIYRLNPPK
jgi:tetratricopeptide (TPR) repeat protein